jgi:hypothetical protein
VSLPKLANVPEVLDAARLPEGFTFELARRNGVYYAGVDTWAEWPDGKEHIFGSYEHAETGELATWRAIEAFNAILTALRDPANAGRDPRAVGLSVSQRLKRDVLKEGAATERECLVDRVCRHAHEVVAADAQLDETGFVRAVCALYCTAYAAVRHGLSQDTAPVMGTLEDA